MPTPEETLIELLAAVDRQLENPHEVSLTLLMQAVRKRGLLLTALGSYGSSPGSGNSTQTIKDGIESAANLNQMVLLLQQIRDALR